ncbi:hypothetical protein NR756_06570 [Alloalcanivorax xenomutans]
MTENIEPRMRELTPIEIEALRKEMHEAIEWAQAELTRRKQHTNDIVGKT